MSNEAALRAAIDENVELTAENQELAERNGHLELENMLLRRQLNVASIDAGAPVRMAFVDLVGRRSDGLLTVTHLELDGLATYPQVVGEPKPCL